MKVAGVREVKNNLSRYLRQVRRGVIVQITDRGEVIAQLGPAVALAAGDAAYQRLVDEGKVLSPEKPWSAALVAMPRGRPRFRAGFVNELIDADRAERS